MARVSYVGEGNAFRRLLNHSQQLSAAYWALRKALDESTLPAKIRMLSFLASDVTNSCEY